jgi:hypothetical protein
MVFLALMFMKPLFRQEIVFICLLVAREAGELI